jgi:hypothetical protein
VLEKTDDSEYGKFGWVMDPEGNKLNSGNRHKGNEDRLLARSALQKLPESARADPADDLVLEIAVAGGCDTIVTFNARDFVGSARFGIRIATPAEFLLSLPQRGAK